MIPSTVRHTAPTPPKMLVPPSATPAIAVRAMAWLVGSPGDPTSQALALAAIAGVALGGTSIFGGVGSIWRTVVGVLMLGLITNGFNLLGVPDFYQDIVRGSLIIAAVALSTLAERN